MKNIVCPLLIILALGATCLVPAGAEEKDVELIAYGRDLFNNKGVNGSKFACILCHKGEKVIKKSAIAKLGDKLPDYINKQLIEKAKGKPLAKDSREMKALEAYIVHEHSH